MTIRTFALLAIASIAALPTAGFAADLIVDSTAATPADSAMYAKLYGGITAPDDLYHDIYLYPMDPGYLLGASIGVSTGIEGFAVELDLNHSAANYNTFDNFLKATSLFGNLVYSIPLTETFSAYGGAGIGAAYVQYDNVYDFDDADGTAFVGQAFAGVEASLADSISLFGELRYQGAFGDVGVEDASAIAYDLEFNRTSLLAGLKFAL